MTDIQGLINAMADILEPAMPNLQVNRLRPGTIETPAVVFSFGGIDYDSTLERGSDEVLFDVNVFTAMGTTDGESQLYDYIKGTGPLSIKALLEANDELAGKSEYLSVTRARPAVIATVGAAQYYMVALEVSVGVGGSS